MQTNCPTCGTAMIPMILSSFCPRDCDRSVAMTPEGEVLVSHPHAAGPPAGWRRVRWSSGGRWFLREELEKMVRNAGRDPATLTWTGLGRGPSVPGDYMNMWLGVPTEKYSLVYSLTDH